MKGENNGVSETYKIIHRKFQPNQNNSSFIKAHKIVAQHKSLYTDIKTIEEENDDFIYVPEELVFETPEDTIKQPSQEQEEASKHTKSLPINGKDLRSTNTQLTKKNTNVSEIHLDEPVPLAQEITNERKFESGEI